MEPPYEYRRVNAEGAVDIKDNIASRNNNVRAIRYNVVVLSAHLSKSKPTRLCPSCLLLLHHSHGGSRTV